MVLDVIRILIALAGTSVAAYQDYKTSFIDEKIVYSMIALGIILNVATLDLNFILYSIGIAAIIFAIGYFFYKAGQLGGGDVLLFAGIQLLLPFYPIELIAFVPRELLAFQAVAPYPFFLSILLASFFFGLVGTSIMYAKKLWGRKLEPNYLNFTIVSLATLAAFYSLAFVARASLAQIIFYLLVFAPGVFLYTFRKQIVDEIVVKRISLKEVEDEDILAIDKMPKEIVKEYELGKVLTKKEVEKLERISKEKGIKLFPVYKVLPRFAPYVLAGLIASLLFGDFFAFILLS